MFVERSSSALSGKVQKFLRERFILYFHVRKHKKESFFAFENNSLNPQRSSIIVLEQFDFKNKIKNSNYKSGKGSCTTWCVFNMTKMK